MCSCGKEPETTLHYLLHCKFYSIYLLELLNDICTLNESLINFLEENRLRVLLYGAEDFTSSMNSEILTCTVKFIEKQTKYLLFNIFNTYFMFNLCREFTVSGICLM